MRKKILFAVMALLTMATGKIWAQGGTTTDGSTAYVVLCEDNSLHFLCSSETLAVGGTLSTNGPIISKVWSGDMVLNTRSKNPSWFDDNNSSVTSVVIDASFKKARPLSCYRWFAYFYNKLTTLDLSNLNTEYVKNMNSMFANSTSLTSLDLSCFKNTSEVTDMSSMFSGCKGLTTLNLSNFDTSNVEDMNNMFYNCRGLTTLDLSSFKTPKLKNIGAMFYGCDKLTSLNLSNFNMSSMTNVYNIFNGCNSLSLLDLSSAINSEEPQKKTISDVIDNLPQNVYPLIYVKDGNEISGRNKNVVVCKDNNNTCSNFIIDNRFTQQPPLIIPAGFTADKVTFKRSFAEGKPHTICLPFELNTSVTDNYKLYEYDTYENGIVKFKDAPATTDPHKPYLLVPNPNTEVKEITVENATISATTSEAAEKEGFNGVYEKRTFTEDEANQKIYYGWANGEFRRAGKGAYVNACRAYLKLPAENGGGNAPARLSIQLGDGTTGIGTAKSGADGGAEAPMYNLQGLRVSGSYRGVVIKNGKKMIVK